MAVIGVAIALLHELRIELGRQLAASHGLHVGEQVDQIFDRRFVCGEPHRVGQSERHAESELCLGQPAIEVMPQQPARDRLG